MEEIENAMTINNVLWKQTVLLPQIKSAVHKKISSLKEMGNRNG